MFWPNFKDTGKKHSQIKPQRLQKYKYGHLGCFVQQINFW